MNPRRVASLMTVSPQWIAISFHFSAHCGHTMSTAPRRLLAFGFALAIAQTLTAGSSLTVDVKIPLGDIAGRIDHLAYDSARQRLYVAELGNNSVGIVDLKQRRLLRTVAGFDEPQGIGYEASTDTVYVANGGDGSLRLFRGAD